MNSQLQLKPYVDQRRRWPERGRVILAQYDEGRVVVYQAYRDSIARAAVTAQTFGEGGFSFERMSWIKPNFLWMMHRSQWGNSPGQERILAIWVRRSAFDGYLAEAVLSHFDEGIHKDRAVWQEAVAASDVRVQWDPDYTPKDLKLPRRAIQIGLRNDALQRYATEDVTRIEDITDFVQQQAAFRAAPEMMFTPAEQIYPVADAAVAAKLRLDKRSP